MTSPVIRHAAVEQRHSPSEYSDVTLTQEAIKTVYNDISALQPISIMQPEIETTHFEDIYAKNRLNKEIDINNINIRRLMTLVATNEQGLPSLDKATLHKIATSSKLEIRMHMDSGANRSVTPHRTLLHNITKCTPITMDGVGGGITTTEYGYLKLTCDDDTYIYAKTYYCPNIDETIVSPTDITLSTRNQFTAWNQYSNVTKGLGKLTFYTASGLGKADIGLCMRNGLWYSSQNFDQLEDWSRNSLTPTLRALTQQAEYALWHQRLGHAGQKVLSNIHKCVDGVPDLNPSQHQFHKCQACMKGKVTSSPKHKQTNGCCCNHLKIHNKKSSLMDSDEYEPHLEEA